MSQMQEPLEFRVELRHNDATLFSESHDTVEKAQEALGRLEKRAQELTAKAEQEAEDQDNDE